jgi:hypothetical protein
LVLFSSFFPCFFASSCMSSRYSNHDVYYDCP